MNWGYRIKRLREAAGLTQNELALRSGLKRSHISRIEAGAYQGVKQATLERLARGLDMPVSRLSEEIYGIAPPSPRETPEEILERFRVVLPATVPIYSVFPHYAGETVEPAGYVSIIKARTRGKMLEAYVCRGQSLEPEVKDGDIIIVDRDGQINNGDVVAYLFEDVLHLARLRKIADVSYLENNQGRRKLEEVQVAAPVIEIRRRLR